MRESNQHNSDASRSGCAGEGEAEGITKVWEGTLMLSSLTSMFSSIFIGLLNIHGKVGQKVSL